MSLFNRLGREVEQFTQRAKEAAEETATYRCRACDATFHVDDECPECGSTDVVDETDDA